jgi:23S rRNA (uridine2552-2'-O)-methyltransferase
MATRITNQKLSKSSRDWMREHLDDPYVKKAQKDGYRARAAYKLLEMQEKYKIIKPGMTVVDLGAAPGSWSQTPVPVLPDIIRLHPDKVCAPIRFPDSVA